MNTLTWIGIVALAVLIGYSLSVLTDNVERNLPAPSLTQEAIANSLEQNSKFDAKGWKNLQFDLVDPEDAPKELRDIIEIGYRLVTNTHELLNGYVGDRLDCSNCHFGGGITTGGVDGGISLAGVAAKYPRYDPETRSIEDLATRVNNCFTKSMNGKPLPVESKEMQAILTYLTWISSRYPIYGKAPWLGVKPLKSKHKPNPINGKKLYSELCADCHGEDGDGGNRSVNHPGMAIPPVFGKNSFNRRAGMNKQDIFASFIYHNMPLGDPHLQVTEALDIAAYVAEQPRPE